MIFEAAVVLVVWTACSHSVVRAFSSLQWCSKIMLTLMLVHVTCSRQCQIGSKALEKRETLWLHDFKHKCYFYFSMCMPCTAGKYRESCGDNSREPLSLFTPAAHCRTSNTVHTALMPMTNFPVSVEEQLFVPLVWEWTCGCWESCWSTRLRLCRLSLKFARSRI